MIDGVLLAVQFMTRLPINKELEFSRKNLKATIAFFPIIGLLIGLIAGMIFKLLIPYSNLVAAGICVSAMTALSGGLHLDGLSDTLDGFFSGRDKDRTMEIMKDSRLGTFGALGLFMVILLKFAFISSIGIDGWIGIPIAMSGGRLAAAWMIWRFPSARKDGLGSLFKESRPGRELLAMSLFLIVLLVIIYPSGIAAYAAAIVTGQIVGLWSMKKINGLTGDVYGAGIEISETVSLAIFWGVMQWILYL